PFHDRPRAAIYALSLHDALPILRPSERAVPTMCSGSPVSPTSRSTMGLRAAAAKSCCGAAAAIMPPCPEACSARPRRSTAGHRRSEEHTSELQSRENLVCRLLLE